MPKPPSPRQPALLLISPGIIKWTDMDFGLPHLVSLGGYVQSKLNLRVELLDLNYEGGDHKHLERVLEEMGPFLLIGISCYSSFDYMRVITLARFIKRLYPDVPIITGGYHASALPEDVLFDGSPFDAVIPGEGEAPVLEICETLLGGGQIERRVWPKRVVADLDELPPYRWELLKRYWPRATQIGRKFQLYLARGCVYHCTFCMERAKSGYTWRAYSAERAVEELERLSRFTDLKRWVINLADPLFGFNRAWRRQVLSGIIEKNLLPRQYWTLTRSDDLHEEDIELLARANFSIGIGMESGSPRMLKLMQKGNKPERYLEAQLRLARLSRRHGLNWAGNIILGHPGETMESMRETHAFARELFASAKETCGWLSIDPFRLYPGSHVHEQMAHYEQTYGTRFYHKQWWKSWYDAPFRAEHLDASAEVDFGARARFMYDHYAPLMREIFEKFRGQGRSIDRVFKRSLEEQAMMMSQTRRDDLLKRARRTELLIKSDSAARSERAASQALEFPLGLHIKDPWVRRREEAVRRLLERGLLRTGALIEALLTTAPEAHMPEAHASAMLRDEPHLPEREGDVPEWFGLSFYALALEALNPGAGERACDLLATSGYLAALCAEMVGPSGEVWALHPAPKRALRDPLKSLKPYAQVRSAYTQPGAFEARTEALDFDAVILAGALPRVTARLTDRLAEQGRLVTILGPRFADQDLVSIMRRDGALHEQRLATLRAPIVAGVGGWLKAPRPLPALKPLAP